MKRFLLYFVILTVMTLTGAAWAEKEKEDPLLQLELNLIDGSRIIGIPAIKSVPVQTSYAKMDVPLKQIKTLKIAEDHEMASIDLQNGDKLKGAISLGPLKLETKFGKVSIKIEHIIDLRVVVAGEATMEGLIAWYNFDDGTAKDASEHKNHGIIHDAKPAPDRFKRKDSAMSFDGSSSWIEVPSSRLYDNLAEISITMWLCPTDNRREDNASYSIISKQPSGSLCNHHGPTTSNHGGLFDLELNIKDEMAGLYFCCQVSEGACSEGYSTDMKLLPCRQWHHLAITASKTENRLKVYIDGRKVDDTVLSKQIEVGHILSQPNNEPLRIGKRKDADFRLFYFSGSMDDIRIYNRVLTDDEVRRTCNANK